MASSLRGTNADGIFSLQHCLLGLFRQPLYGLTRLTYFSNMEVANSTKFRLFLLLWLCLPIPPHLLHNETDRNSHKDISPGSCPFLWQGVGESAFNQWETRSYQCLLPCYLAVTPCNPGTQVPQEATGGTASLPSFSCHCSEDVDSVWIRMSVSINEGLFLHLTRNANFFWRRCTAISTIFLTAI